MQGKNEKNGGFSVPEARLRQVLESEEGQELIAMLQKQNAQTISRAVDAAQRGDAAAAKKAVQAILKDRKTAELVGRLEHG